MPDPKRPRRRILAPVDRRLVVQSPPLRTPQLRALFLGDLLPSTNRAIYLDSDVFVRRDLGRLDDDAALLFELDPEAVVAVAPRDFKKVCRVVDCPKVADLGAKPSDLHAFNAGVVVYDLDRWRRLGMREEAHKWILANAYSRIYALGSNPPFVLAVRSNFARLDPRWNCMRGTHKQHAHNLRCWDDAYIRHYPGDDKPWHHQDPLDSLPPAHRPCLSAFLHPTTSSSSSSS
ncbi:hypothetical protein CTAYLR_003127 [Chrysophaeum taylorii]|uniref:Hexosyltransferase n=1 Tax=Chrysophaeum taylorii TaxID=2483200 RepID=A0AAD7UQR8_9STRA|nr:hypothetical protein CTAYLR_003127 [Chrysophaeum taylorii]